MHPCIPMITTCIAIFSTTFLLSADAFTYTFDVDPELVKRMGGVEQSKKRALILNGQVYFDRDLLNMVAPGGKLKEEYDYSGLAVCHGVKTTGSSASYFACHVGKYCCEKSPQQYCCEAKLFGEKNDRTVAKIHAEMTRVVIITVAVICVCIFVCIISCVVIVCVIVPKREKPAPTVVKSAPAPYSHQPSPQQSYYPQQASGSSASGVEPPPYKEKY